MTARLTKWDGAAPDRATIERQFRDEGLSPSTWGNSPEDTYGAHAHGYHKVLFCVSGGIVFHTAGGDLAMEPGDRLDVEPDTAHSATLGPAGVECMEASR